MSRRAWTIASLAVATIGLLLTGQFSASHGQQPARDATRLDSDNPARFEFDIVESFDAQYLGDTPGHHGRSGGLDKRRPRLALGDPVYRGNERVGNLTQIRWDRGGASLDLEFDPVPQMRVNVGDTVWVALDGSKAPAPQQ